MAYLYLTKDLCREIKQQYNAGQSIRKLAATYHLNPKTIHKILRAQICPQETTEVHMRDNKLKAGEKHPKAKLSDSDVEEIRLRRALGDTLRNISVDFGISEAYVIMLMKKIRRKHPTEIE